MINIKTLVEWEKNGTNVILDGPYIINEQLFLKEVNKIKELLDLLYIDEIENIQEINLFDGISDKPTNKEIEEYNKIRAVKLRIFDIMVDLINSGQGEWDNLGSSINICCSSISELDMMNKKLNIPSALYDKLIDNIETNGQVLIIKHANKIDWATIETPEGINPIQYFRRLKLERILKN